MSDYFIIYGVGVLLCAALQAGWLAFRNLEPNPFPFILNSFTWPIIVVGALVYATVRTIMELRR